MPRTRPLRIALRPAEKLLFGTLAAVFLLLGLLAVLNQSYTAVTKHQGVVVLAGADAVYFGCVSMVLGLLFLFVWVPYRWAHLYLGACILVLMSAIFIPLMLR